MKIKNIFQIAVLSGAVLISSCTDSYLDQKPQASLDAKTAYVDAASAKAGLLGIYSGFQSGDYYGLRFWALTDMYANTLSHTGTFPSFAQINNKAILADNTEITNMWNRMYSTVNRANTLLAAIPTITDPALNKDAYTAEVKTLRAMIYFDLLRLFGGSNSGYNQSSGVGVPIVLTPTLVETDATPVAKSTEAQVFTQIKKDLDDAIAVTSFSNKILGRMGKDAAKMLRARVALYTGDYASAESLSTELISSGRYTMLSGANYANIWLTQNTSESIFELQFDAQNSNAIAFFYYPTTLGGRNEINSSGTLNSAHEVGDVRQEINYTTTSPKKITKKYTRVSTGADDVTIMRMSELFLIRAESRAKKSTPDIAGALADLNVVRSRAGLANFGAILPADINTQIVKENRIEFAHEGHIWFDLRRNGLAGTIVTEAYKALWPIPQREVLNSGGVITQNAGY
nr:RagB/SusD family nutrient uptake outer membrane protein [Pseudopedobacter sp.]